MATPRDRHSRNQSADLKVNSYNYSNMKSDEDLNVSLSKLQAEMVLGSIFIFFVLK